MPAVNAAVIDTSKVPPTGAQAPSVASVNAVPSINHGKPDRNQVRNHSTATHAAGITTNHRIAPRAGDNRAAIQPNPATNPANANTCTTVTAAASDQCKPPKPYMLTNTHHS